jgi:muconolactone D-isomerase
LFCLGQGHFAAQARYRRAAVDFLVEMQIGIPPDLDPALVADLIQRERSRAAEISAEGQFFRQVWIVPGERARILICTAADAAELHEKFQSLPAFIWSKFKVTPLIECQPGAPICIVN